MATSDRTSAADGHLLIGGTGRAGTTLLVQWFTVMGFDTGFTVEEALGRVDPISNAGLEHSLSRTLEIGERLPYVAKSPWFGPKIGDYIERGRPAGQGGDPAASLARGGRGEPQAGLEACR